MQAGVVSLVGRVSLAVREAHGEAPVWGRRECSDCPGSLLGFTGDREKNLGSRGEVCGVFATQQFGGAVDLATERTVDQYGDIALSRKNADCNRHQTPLFVWGECNPKALG